MTKQICEISVSSWFYYKEICYDARSHERKERDLRSSGMLTQRRLVFSYVSGNLFVTPSRVKQSCREDRPLSKLSSPLNAVSEVEIIRTEVSVVLVSYQLSNNVSRVCEIFLLYSPLIFSGH